MKTAFLILVLAFVQFNNVECLMKIEHIRYIDRTLLILMDIETAAGANKDKAVAGCSIFKRNLEALLNLDSNDTIDVFFGASDTVADHICLDAAECTKLNKGAVTAIAFANVLPQGTDVKAAKADITTGKVGTFNHKDFCDIEIALRDDNAKRSLVL